jgi:hypothetical protein
MPDLIELLVMGDGEGTETGSNRVVASRLDPDVVRGICINEMHGRAVEEAIYLLGSARVAAQEAVVAQHPEIAGLRDCLVGWSRNLVRVGKPRLELGLK